MVLSFDIEGEDDLLYYVGDTFSLDGLTIYANMSDGEKIDVTNEVSCEEHIFTIEEGIDEIAEIGIEYKGVTDYVATLVDFKPISQARKAGDGEIVTINGAVTGKFVQNEKYSIFVEDDTAAVMLYNIDENLEDPIQFGDEIAVEGELDLYNGLFELKTFPR